ncbi:COG1399 protein, clustered with ribosomal protein L32p [uncultured Candidatus Thioglobus sp.]|nr:COG1399 protein, clustered with ribosomal protein L32p [uncultured Candidatus Thioglobus sp.]
MKQGIPDTIKLFRFASRSLTFSQCYQVKDLPRISKLLSNQDSTVDVKLSFNLEEGKIPCIKGEIKLDAVLTCQRCLDEVSIHLQPKFQLAFLQNEQQGETLSTSFETILNTDEEFSTIEFITDEVLIVIPMTPMHKHKCASYQDTQPINQQKRENPFAILQQLKNTTKE